MPGVRARVMSERQVDQKLVVKVQQGDKTAFDVLVLKYQHKVIKVIISARTLNDHLGYADGG